MKKLITLIIALALLSGCGSSKKPVVENKSKPVNKTIKQPQPKVDKPQKTDENPDFETLRYIAKFEDIAKKEMKEYGIPASITIAQGVLESNSGKSRLAVEGNNHFGIKCHKQWPGEKIMHDDDALQECFRKYDNPNESYKDHSKFLTHRKRYAFLFRLPKTDYEAWARGLRKAGYATDPSYPDKLIYIIEKYNLDKFDKEVLKQMNVKINEVENEQNNNKKFIYVVQAGETLFTIAKKFNVPVKEIQRINNLNDFDIYEGKILFLTDREGRDFDNVEETEADKINNNNNVVQSQETPIYSTKQLLKDEVILHVVKQGETLFFISKSHNVDIEKLRQINNLPNNTIKVGQIIKIPVNTSSQTSEPKPGKHEMEIVEKIKPEKSDEEKAVYHIVKPGETLYRIHVNYNVPISQLRKLNNLKGNNIKVGQKLRLR